MGARPQFIKAAAFGAALESHSGVAEVLIHTGQHYDYEMSQVFFDGLDLPAPTHHLGVGSGPHGAQTGEMLKRLEPLLMDEPPDVVVVHGDTNSTLAGALAAVKLRIPVAHVEAGLRSYRLDMPEEVNRVMTDHVSAALYCPTETAVKNLADEGIREGVVLCGDVMRDVLESSMSEADGRIALLDELGVKRGEYAVATIHRSENTVDVGRLHRVLAGLSALAKEMSVVLPLHPRTRDALGDTVVDAVNIIKPLGYADMVCLSGNARVIVTDSGGLQKEAYWLGVPCVTPRRETEWVETLAGGWNVLVDADTDRIAKEAARPAPDVARDDSFGGHDASARIAEHLVSTFG